MLALLFWLAAAPVLFFLLLPFVSVAAAQLAGTPKRQQQAHSASIGIIFCAYKDASITQAGLEALAPQVVGTAHQIYVVADDSTRLPDLTALPADVQVQVLQPKPALHSKVKSLAFARSQFAAQHTHTLVLDADNVPAPHFLKEIESTLAEGWVLVQGRRTALNEETAIARLDSVNEIYYNYVVRHVPFVLGSSSTLSGSAMVLENGLLDQWLADMHEREKHGVVVAEDKLLQIYAVAQGHRLAYNPRAWVFDAKISSGQQLQRQRTRWLNAWIRTVPQGLRLCGQGLATASWNRLYFGWLQIAPPMFMLLAGALLLAMISLPFAPAVSVALLGALFLFALNLFWVLRLAQAPASVCRGLTHVPAFVFRQMLALIQFRKADKSFLHTTHGSTGDVTSGASSRVSSH